MIKAVVLDMDGTVLPANSWQELHRSCGLLEAEDQVMLRWYSEGAISYGQWTDLIASVYRARGMATRDAVLAAFDRCAVDPSAEELVAEIQRRGLRLILLSGGVDDLVDRVADHLGIEERFANHRIAYGADGWFAGFEIQGDDAQFKVARLMAFCKRHAFLPHECMCVGDGCNDRLIFELTGRGVLYCPPGRVPPDVPFWRRVENLRDVVMILKEATQ
jgi:phosphoserine phosphatase